MKFILFPDMSGYVTSAANALKKEGELNIEFSEKLDGTLFISDKAVRVKSGLAVIPLTEINEGENRVTLYRSGSSRFWSCGIILKEGDELIPIPEDSSQDFVNLKKLVYSSITTISALEKKIEKLEEKTDGYKVF
ncbi:MAG: hypothetical protein SOZ62_02605 [Eubacteriales bacterium]|nr:hypothetical protein [Eubacteriales bacterium]